MNEHARLMRVRYDLFNQPIPSSAVSALDVVAKSVLLDIRNRTLEVALLFMEERFPICDEELHITYLRAVDRGIVDLVQNAVRKSEPDSAGGCICGPYPLLGTGSPARWDSRATESGTC